MAGPADIAQLERTYTLIERGPQTFVAALFALVAVFLLTMLVREHRHALKREREHTDEIKAIFTAERDRSVVERERAVKLELVVAEFTDKMEKGLLSVKPATKRVRQTADPAAPDAPTIVTVASVPERVKPQ